MTSEDQTRAQASRSRLLSAAIEAFAEKGFHGTTTRDITTAAGLSPAALYLHHKSKEELLYLISRAGHENTLRLVRTAIESAPDPIAQLRQVAYDAARYHARDHTSGRIVNYELAALTPRHRTEIRRIRRQIEQEIRRLIERGADAGVFRTRDTRMAAIALLSLVIDISRWYRDDRAWTPEEVAERYVDVALRIADATGVGSAT